MLINSIYYFIDCVFILREKDNYRLVALQHSRVLCDNRYRTPGGCRIAFNKLYNYKAWDKQVKANWSPFYDPDKPWWGKKSTIMKTGKRQEDQQ